MRNLKSYSQFNEESVPSEDGAESLVTQEELEEMEAGEREADELEEAKDKSEVTSKDRMRIDDIIRKAHGNHAKAIALTQTMCKLILDPQKAVRRMKAAQEAGEDDLAEIFDKRATELGAYGG